MEGDHLASKLDVAGSERGERGEIDNYQRRQVVLI